MIKLLTTVYTEEAENPESKSRRKLNIMKLSSLLRWVIVVIIIIIIAGGTIIIIVVRGPVPEPPPCPACGINLIKLLGIAEVVLGIISLGLLGRIKNLNDRNF
jgi:hypothetical protein